MIHDRQPGVEGFLYRWNDPLHRVDLWINDAWHPSALHQTSVTIPMQQLVTYEETWCEPCEGITDPGVSLG